MSKLILGLDLGSNSIGWAVIRLLDNEDPVFVPVAIGSRIFNSCMDPKKDIPNNVERRIKRGMRRRTFRRAKRKKLLRHALIQIGLFPADKSEEKALINSTDPYVLRSKALSEKLPLHHLGRIFLHLSQRRGFFADRHTEKKEKSKEDEGMLAEINNLEKKLNGHTLGQFFSELHHDPHTRIRGMQTNRALYLEEFDRIWNFQKQFYPDLLTDSLRFGSQGQQKYPVRPVPLQKSESPLQKFGIHGLIFFQRKIYWPQDSIGRCEYEKNEPRIKRADRRFQRYRIFQEVNNLRIIPENMPAQRLTPQQRAIIVNELLSAKDRSFPALRKKLKLNPQDRFNFEMGDEARKKLDGNTSDFALKKDVFDEKIWDKMDEATKDHIVETLLDDNIEESEIFRRAKAEWHLNDELAEKLSKYVFKDDDRASVSLKAILKILPELEAGYQLQGKNTEDSAIHRAGYQRRDEIAHPVRDRLPLVPDDITNPRVKHALHEVRRLIHAVIRVYGRPDAIHIELARDLKANKKERQKMAKENAENRDRKLAIYEKIKEFKSDPTEEDVARFILWEDQGGECLYSGRGIHPSQFLFGTGEIDVDHILPLRRSMDDSRSNKVLCYAEENRAKGNRTPFEWATAIGNLEKYHHILARARNLKGPSAYARMKKIETQDLTLEELPSQHLNDTRYISRKVAEFVAQLGVKVQCTKGQHTAALRDLWQLNGLIRSDDVNKKFRGDHRHHAIDAAIIAITGPATLKSLEWYLKLRNQVNKEQRRHQISQKIGTDFRSKLAELLDKMIVSHQSSRKIKGSLHADSYFGPTQKRPENPIPRELRPHARNWEESPDKLVITVDLKALKPKDVEFIRDPVVRQIVKDRLIFHRQDLSSSKPVEGTVWLEPEPLRMKSKKCQGPLIKKVRMLEPNNLVNPVSGERLHLAIRNNTAFVKPDNRHHIALFEMPGHTDKKPKRDLVSVPMLQMKRKTISNRIRKAENLSEEKMIVNVHPEISDARFMLSLVTGEMVYGEFAGSVDFYVFNTAASTSKQMFFYHHLDSERKNTSRVSCMPNTMKFNKVKINILGQLIDPEHQE